MSAKVALVDSGGTNIGSVSYALSRLGAESSLTSNADEILSADRVILPGVGAAGAGMARLHELGLVEVLRQVQQPLMGVCLGMQLLFEHSEEDGGVDCLGLIPGKVIAIPASASARVPHMGWNTLVQVQEDPLSEGIRAGDRAYFVHSYAAPVSEVTLLSTEHGQPWSAAVRSGQHWGAQFHPEKSADVGARILRNFLSEDLT